MPTCRENFYLGQYKLLLVGNKIPTQQLPPHNNKKIVKKPKIKRKKNFSPEARPAHFPHHPPANSNPKPT